MSYKKRKDPNGGLTKLSKFERQQSLRTKETKYGDIVQSIGGPVSSVEDVRAPPAVPKYKRGVPAAV
jgi:hypothetical protein